MRQITPLGLKLKKIPGISPVSSNFEARWNAVLHDAEKGLVKRLFEEALLVKESLQRKLDGMIKEHYPITFEKELSKILKSNVDYRIMLMERRKRKWNKLKPGLNIEKPKEKRINT